MSKKFNTSTEFINDPIKQTEIHEEKSHIYIDWGRSIPEIYVQDAIYGLVRDPFCILFYWELTGNNRTAAGFQHLGGGWKLIISGNGENLEHDAAWPAGTYYYGTQPSSEYIGKIGWMTGMGRFIMLAETPPIRTPSNRPSQITNQEFWSVEDVKKQLQTHSTTSPGRFRDIRSSLYMSRQSMP